MNNLLRIPIDYQHFKILSNLENGPSNKQIACLPNQAGFIRQMANSQ